jgi:hypothetical protein
MVEIKNSLIKDVVLVLSDGFKIKLENGLEEPYNSLVSGGYANYDNGIVSKNWKTEYWHEEIPIPIRSRFEILDL